MRECIDMYANNGGVSAWHGMAWSGVDGSHHNAAGMMGKEEDL